MGRTIDVAAAAAVNGSEAVLPVEYARSVVVENPAGLLAEKILSMMIAHAGGGMGLDRWHVLDSALIREYASDGVSHLSVPVLRRVAKELLAMQVEYWMHDERRKRTVGELGVVVDRVKVELDDSEHGRGRLLMRFKLGSLYRELASRSDFWVRLSSEDVLRLTSRYGVRLHRYLSSYQSIEGRRDVTVDLQQLRKVMGMGPRQYDQFKTFNRWVLKPAVADINQRPGWDLECQQLRRNRRVALIRFAWKGMVEEANEAVVTRGPTVGFPENGVIDGTDWGEMARALGGGVAVDHIGKRWVGWVARKNDTKAKAGDRDRLRLNDERRFAAFCRRFAEEGTRVVEVGESGGEEEVVREMSAVDEGLEFPITEMVHIYRYWRDLAEKHGGSVNVDHVGREFQRYCESCGIALDAADIRDRFVMFCKRRVWREPWHKKTEMEARALTWSRGAGS